MKNLKFNLTDRQIKILVIDVIAVLVIVLGLWFITTQLAHSDSAPPAHSGSSYVIQPVKIGQPASAADVASSINCGQFKDAGSGLQTNGMVVDSGTCWIDGHKYGIDTFIGKDVRDTWLSMAEKLGVAPQWETDTAVVYPSTQS